MPIKELINQQNINTFQKLQLYEVINIFKEKTDEKVLLLQFKKFRGNTGHLTEGRRNIRYPGIYLQYVCTL